MGLWEKKDHESIKQTVFNCLHKNANFRHEEVLGVPASHLDSNVFYDDAPFLADAPYLSSMIANPNHIGCHTLGDSEPFFQGTHELEKQVIKICSEEILHASPDSIDGYVATGGTEANIQAYWTYRNYFIHEHYAKKEEILLLGSEDCHYSFYKGANLLGIDHITIPVQVNFRSIKLNELEQIIQKAKKNGKKYFIVQLNMATTMFGSVDNVDQVCEILMKAQVEFKIHADGAFGGFIYPFTKDSDHINMSFKHPHISSFTLDAHKMLQAPYGTGIFLIRKGMIQHACTKEAQYVNGMDLTLSGSRSGANAISVWMILMTYGKSGWKEKITSLVQRTDWLCEQLDILGISYFRFEKMNIVTIRGTEIPTSVAHKFGLVPDSHASNPKWWKIVVMDHVSMTALERFVDSLKKEKVVMEYYGNHES